MPRKKQPKENPNLELKTIYKVVDDTTGNYVRARMKDLEVGDRFIIEDFGSKIYTVSKAPYINDNGSWAIEARDD